MRRYIMALVCAVLIAALIPAFADEVAPDSPAAFLLDKGWHTFVWPSATEEGINGFEDGSGFEATSFCALIWDKSSGQHRIIWRESTGDVHYAQNDAEALMYLWSPLMSHLGVVGHFTDLCQAFNFDVAMYTDGGTCYFGLPEARDDMDELFLALSAGKPYIVIEGWNKYISQIALH